MRKVKVVGKEYKVTEYKTTQDINGNEVTIADRERNYNGRHLQNMLDNINNRIQKLQEEKSDIESIINGEEGSEIQIDNESSGSEL